jgi:plasmid maintenance system antidote protein VapI
VTTDLPDRRGGSAAAMQVPRTLTTAGLRERFGDPDRVEPAAGQVRRVEWNGVSQLALLLTGEDRRWRIVPVSIEPTGEDETSLIVDASRTTFPVEVTAWAGLATTVPTGVLSRVIDTWEPDLTRWCGDANDGVLREPPAGTRRGEASDPYGSSAAVRDALADDIETLTFAPLVPVQEEAIFDIRAATTRVGLRAVMDALQLPQATVMKIVQNKQTISETQAKILASLFGCSPEDILAGANALPLALAVELEQPRWRTLWSAMAQRLGITETAARLTVGFGTFATAYRQTGAVTPDWRSRIEQWLTANEHDTARPAQGD